MNRGHTKTEGGAPVLFAEARAFARAARCYWLEIFPLTRRERSIWGRRAVAIPDPQLRRDAIFTHETKWGNVEGAAAFGVLVPRPRRPEFVRLVTAYETMIDYIDTTSERPVEDPFGNTLHLHRALDAALGLELPREDYYASHPHCDDGGYLDAHISACREVLTMLPSRQSVSPRLGRLAHLYSETQGLFHAAAIGLDEADRAHCTLAEAARYPELHWGELLAAGGSSIVLFALLAAATTTAFSTRDAELLDCAYYPWSAALHISLDGLIDRSADRAAGHANQISHYSCEAEVAERLVLMATHSRERLLALPRGDTHGVILAGMAAFYLSDREAWAHAEGEIAKRVLAALGGIAGLALLVHRARRFGRSELRVSTP